MSERTLLETALLHGWALDGAGGGRALDAAAATAAQGQEGGGPVWLHLDRSVPGLDAWLLQTAGVPAAAVDALLAEDTRPRCEAWPEGLLLNLRGVNLNPGAAPEDMLAVRLWATPRLVITLRQRPIMATRDLNQRLVERRGPRDIAEFLGLLAEGLTDRMAPVLSDMEEALDALEERSERDDRTLKSDDLTALRSQASALRRFIAPQQAAVARLAALPEDWIPESVRLSLRQTNDDVTRYVEMLDSLREQATILKDGLAQKQAERMNLTMYALTLVAGVFLPLGFLTGLLGINVGGMPGVESGDAFWIVCGALVVIAVAEWAFLKWRRLI